MITVSNFSKQELIRLFGAPEKNIVVTYLGIEHVQSTTPDPTVLKRYGLTPKAYVFAVGSANPNKNVQILGKVSEALTDLGMQFVVAGGRNDRAFSNEGLLPKGVTRLGYVNERELRALYENAGCFVFPSLYEGFGLPPLEAICLGTPVVVSNCSSMPEVFAGCALFADPQDPLDFARQIRNALSGQGASYDERRRWASQFSWSKCARETWRVLEACKS